ncbi:hypothetical protein GBAR_LOCUS13480 [Geodia barretti]|uniref:Uncharacterized protein n=1 Tax=Geodia barretti TaxID=519541 RepID=A0AA35S3Z6_GEOBA|nr:hypothetical protein GBAR_LOCUS13480 [Geodia barretti]
MPKVTPGKEAGVKRGRGKSSSTTKGTPSLQTSGRRRGRGGGGEANDGGSSHQSQERKRKKRGREETERTVGNREKRRREVRGVVDSEEVEERGRNGERKGRMGRGGVEQRERSGRGESVEKKGRGRAKEVRVSDATTAKWTPVSRAARELLSNTMISALGQCMEEVRGPKKRLAETAIQQVIQRVECEVGAVKAPPSKRIKQGSALRQRLTELKEQCFDLMSRNEEMERTAEERKLFCKEKSKVVEQFEDDAQGLPPAHPPPPDMSDLDQETFRAHFQELLLHTPETVRTNALSL